MSQTKSYRKVTQKIKAFQWNGEKEPVPAPLYKCHGGVFIETATQILEVHKGDYIIFTDEYGHDVMPEAAFKAAYEPAE